MAKRRGNSNGNKSRPVPAAAAANSKPVDGETLDAKAVMAGADVINQPADSEGLKDAGKEPSGHTSGENDQKAEGTGTGDPNAASTPTDDSRADKHGGDAENSVSSASAGDIGAGEAVGVDDGGSSNADDGSQNAGTTEDSNGDPAASTGDGTTPAAEPDGADQLSDGSNSFADSGNTERSSSNLTPVSRQHCRMCDEPLTPANCPICRDPFKGSDLCATDIELGTCHAECLEGSPVVDLMTGEPSGKKIHTFLYYEDAIEEMHSSVVNAAYVMRDIAWNAATDIADQFAGIQVDLDIQKVGSPFTDEAMDRELVEFTRRLGRNATPDVLATQLMIKKLRSSNALTTPERIALQAFITVLLDLDEYAAAEKARIDAEATEKPTPRPVPIEDTTMELVDDHDATF